MTAGAVHLFFAGYFNDLLAGTLILAIVNLLLVPARLPPLDRPLPATAFILLCGCFWEFVTPLYRPESVCDPLDLLAYLAGAWVYLGLCALWRRCAGRGRRSHLKGA